MNRGHNYRLGKVIGILLPRPGDAMDFRPYSWAAMRYFASKPSPNQRALGAAVSLFAAIAHHHARRAEAMPGNQVQELVPIETGLKGCRFEV